MAIDFGGYIEQRRTGIAAEGGSDQYAYAGDLKLQKTMRTFKPIELAVASTVRLGKGVLTGDLLGSAVKVSPRQFPRVHAMARHCAETLGITLPQVFIQGRIDSINAMTTGTDKEAVIVVHTATLDLLTDDELLFVLGHECGHIQNGHVVYLTTLNILTQLAGAFVGPLVQPALIALQGWSRAAELTCDRAGLLCCGKLDVAEQAFLKLTTGSKRVYEQLNVAEYLDQLREGREGLGRAAELMKSHPYITKRIEALRVFAQSEVYQRARGTLSPEALPLVEVDRRVEEIVKVL